MTRTAKNLIIAMTLVSLSAFASQVEADEYHHIDGLANQIQNKARVLLKETAHYRHTPYYNCLRNDAKAFRRLARHINTLAKRRADINHIESDLTELGVTLRHIEGLIAKIENDAQYCIGTIIGHTRHVKRLVCDIEDCINHMLADVRAIQARYACPSRVRRAIVVETPVYVPRRSTPTRSTYNRGYDSYRSRSHSRGYDSHGYGSYGRDYDSRGYDSRGYDSYDRGYSRGYDRRYDSYGHTGLSVGSSRMHFNIKF